MKTTAFASQSLSFREDFNKQAWINSYNSQIDSVSVPYRGEDFNNWAKRCSSGMKIAAGFRP